jgi:hypothetical protein
MAGLAAEMAVPKDLARWGSEPFGIKILERRISKVSKQSLDGKACVPK